ncbi:MAG: hypothetical protein EOM12_09875 [Verrucomicrobiae bacterium]|nr:hypothetical protein [Verrucomicrobiae bacterium]
MSEYKFEPDYKALWNRPDLSEEDLAWMMLHVNPDDVRKEKETLAKERSSHEDDMWRSAFGDYISNLPEGGGHFLGKNFQDIIKRELWDGSKESFIKNAYDWGMDFPPAFESFLKSLRPCPLPTTYDSYKNHEKYSDSIKDWPIEKVDSENAALPLLMGLEPEYFNRYTKALKKRKMDASWNMSNLEPEERHFLWQYLKFLRKEYDYLDSPHFTLFRFWESVKEKALWKGELNGYVQALHNEGFIFPKQTYDALREKEIVPAYDKDGWAMRFYKRWLKEGGWTLQESLSLFRGQDPRGEGWRSFFSIGQNPWLFTTGSESSYAWDEFDEKFYELKHRVARHVEVGKLPAFSREGVDEKLFRPEAIVTWLLKHVLYIPPEPLLLVTLNPDEKKVFDEGRPEREKEQKRASDQYAQSMKQETRGRKQGDGRINDDVPVQKMRELLMNNKASSLADAARQVVGDVAGAATEDSKIRRLCKKYNDAYPKADMI